jgi:glycerol-3-phosphate acyltransferase PlsX
MRIGIDAMGSDGAPEAEVRGALEARSLLGDDDRIVLVGREEQVRARLDQTPGWQDKIDLVHAEQVIGMNESPVEALKSKPRCSMIVMAEMHRLKQLDACISAGNTGAYVAASQMRLGRLGGVSRPGILVVTPTPRGPVALCDVGANVQPRAQHLREYGVMASFYMMAIHNIARPRVGLLSVGEEDAKGNELIKEANELLRGESAVNFIGNVEGRDLFRGTCDVMICDGFTGNVVLKLMEGMAEGVIKAMLQELAGKLPPEQAVSLKGYAKDIVTKFDYNEYGGAPLIGVNGICIICHGSSSYRGIMNAVRVAREFSTTRLNERMSETLSAGSVHG